MEDKPSAGINESTPLLPKSVNRRQVKEVYPVAGEVVLRRQRLYDLGDLLRQLAVAGEQLQEDEANARVGRGDL